MHALNENIGEYPKCRINDEYSKRAVDEYGEKVCCTCISFGSMREEGGKDDVCELSISTAICMKRGNLISGKSFTSERRVPRQHSHAGNLDL